MSILVPQQISNAFLIMVAAVALSVSCTRSNPSSASSEPIEPSRSAAPAKHVSTDKRAPDDGGSEPEAREATKESCVQFQPARSMGRVQNKRLGEISGVVSSRRHVGVLWVHNDSGDSARVYAIDTAGALLGMYRLRGARATDWEDLAIAPGDSRDLLYVGDIGDNGRRRPYITIYRFDEPNPNRDGGLDGIEWIDTFSAFRCVYPNGERYDAETLLFDPSTSCVYLITKDAAGRSILFKAPTPLSEESLNTLVREREIPIPGLVPRATGGDIAPHGDGILLRTYTDVLLWPRSTGMPLARAFDSVPLTIEPPAEEQGESVGYAADGLGFYTISEGIGSEVHFTACRR